MEQPVFYLLAGPNGAGKSTLYRALVLAGTIPAAAEFVNADLHEAAHLLERVAQRVLEGGHPVQPTPEWARHVLWD
jgi:predicted ABC-type ATPase